MNTAYPEKIPMGNSIRVKPVQFQEGTLTIDFVDAQTGLQVWRGVESLIEWDAEIEKTV